MSDDDDNTPHGFHFAMPFPFRQPTEAELAEHKRQSELHEMRVLEFQHGFQSMLEEAPQEHLSLLQTMFGIVVENTNFPVVAGWQGQVAAALKYRFGVCPAHGVNHEQEFFEKKDTEKDYPDDFVGTVEALNQPDTPLVMQVLGDDGKWVPCPIRWDEATVAKMKEYHLDDAYDSDTKEFLGFSCTGVPGANGPCGLRYPSLEDRMIKEPDNCHGCQIRAGHG